MMKKPKGQLVPKFDPLVPEGEYLAVCAEAHEPRYQFRGFKLSLSFSIKRGPFVDGRAPSHSEQHDEPPMGGHVSPVGQTVRAHFNVTKRGNTYTFGPRSRLWKAFSLLHGHDLRKLPDVIMDHADFAGERFVVDVRTVRVDAQGARLAPDDQYSIVATLKDHILGRSASAMAEDFHPADSPN